MAATLSLDTITSSGSTITVPTGKTISITDAGNLTIGGVAITTGAQGVLSKTAAYTILPGDFTGKSSLIVFVDVSAGTATETVITLPAAADFSTCAIHVVSTTTHGAGNYITIKNSSAVEQYSLYKKGDHCECVSDATNIFRTGNEHATIYTLLASSADEAAAGASFNRCFQTNYTTVANLGDAWHTTNDEFTAPCDGLISISYDLKSNTGTSAGSPVIYMDTGSGFVIKRGSLPGSAASSVKGSSTWVFDIAATNVIRPYYWNNTGTAEGVGGNAGLTRTQLSFLYVRRY
jgi:uncharacterized Zn-binding protein involved in type VI secretion